MHKILMNYYGKIVTCLFFAFCALLLKNVDFDINNIVEKDKCPACFGLDICQDIEDGKLIYEFYNFYSIFNNFFNVKNVYYGNYKKKKVIMKKLAHTTELESFDTFLCSNEYYSELCSTNRMKLNTRVNYYEEIMTVLSDRNMADANKKIRCCPTVSNIEELFQNIKMTDKDHDKYLWTMIHINPEPIVLQVLKAENGWPTPKYYGACGRLVVEENVGLPLAAFKKESWIIRANIASSLLEAAYKFTFKDPKFGFYLTDVSVDNIAVNHVHEAKFIDLENIILVDKNPPKNVLDQFNTWNETHVNVINEDCLDCFIFSPQDICSHMISDHNYYAVCKHILTLQGLLHGPPQDIVNEHPFLIKLLEDCSMPDELLMNSRIDSGMRLKSLLDRILQNVK